MSLPVLRIQIRDPVPFWPLDPKPILLSRVSDPDPSVGWPLLRAEGFFCNLDILYGGLGIGKLQFFIQKKFNFFFSCNFFQFLVIKALDPDWIRIRSGLQPPTPDPEKMNTDPKPCIWELSDNFLGKKFYNSLKIGPNFFLQHFITKIMYNFVKFVAT